VSGKLGAILVAALLASAAQAGGEGCRDGRLDLTAGLERIEKRAREAAAKVMEGRLAEEKRLPNPRAAKQVQAPSGASADASPVDNPSLPELFALAIDNELLDVSERQAFSASLNPFAFVTLFRPGVAEDEKKYQSYWWLRKLDGKLTLGGKGDAFDRDGDGKADEALRAKDLSDSVTWEVRFRAIGSRDRREKPFVDRYRKKVAHLVEAEVDAYGSFVTANWRPPRADSDACMSADDLEALLKEPALQAQLAEVGVRSLRTTEAIDAAVKDVDRRLVITLFASGTRREEELGPDKTSFGVRAGWGRGLLDHTVNLDWSEQEGIRAAPDPRVFKFGYQASGEIQGAGFEGSRLSVFGAWERYSNVPSAKHRTVAKAGGKLEVRLADGLTLPISVTWANHRDLLSDSDEIVRNVAIALDLSDLRKPKKSPSAP